MAKLRSPNCPTMTLQDALDRGRKVYSKEHTHTANRAVVAGDLGYSGVSGASATVIGALRQYGILEGRGDDMRISDKAVDIYELPEGDPERNRAMSILCYSPPLFRELYDQYKERLPGDGNLRHTLIKKGFLPETADEVIETYKENLKFVGNHVAEYNKEDDDEESENEMTPAAEARPQAGKTPPPPSPPASLNRTPVGSEIPVAKDCVMGVAATGRVTQEGIEKLIAYLGLIKGSFPNENEPIQ